MSAARRTAQGQDALERLHFDLIEQLLHELARHQGLGPFGELSDTSKSMLINEARKMCRAWSSDPALRETYEPRKSTIVDLVAEQHRVAEVIASARREWSFGTDQILSARR